MAWLFRFTCWVSSRIANEFEVWRSVHVRGAACRHGPDALPVLGLKKRSRRSRFQEGTPVKTSTSTYVNYTGWWFGTWLLFFHILGLIIPTDFHIFQRGWNHQPVYIPSYFSCTYAALHIGPLGYAQAQLQAALYPWWRWRSQGRPAIGLGGQLKKRGVSYGGILRSCGHIPTGLGLKIGEFGYPKIIQSPVIHQSFPMFSHENCNEMGRPPFWWWTQQADVLLRSWSRSIMNVHWRGSQGQKPNPGSKTQATFLSTRST